MPDTTAWLLPLGNNLRAAIGEREMIHLVDDPEFFELPESPIHCNQTIVWQGDVLPVIDIAAWLDGHETKRSEQTIVGIVAYQESEDGLPVYGGLLLQSIPVKQLVSNRQACALPEPHKVWESLAWSCYSDNGRSTPILNLARIFSKKND